MTHKLSYHVRKMIKMKISTLTCAILRNRGNLGRMLLVPLGGCKWQFAISSLLCGLSKIGHAIALWLFNEANWKVTIVE